MRSTFHNHQCCAKLIKTFLQKLAGIRAYLFPKRWMTPFSCIPRTYILSINHVQELFVSWSPVAHVVVVSASSEHFLDGGVRAWLLINLIVSSLEDNINAFCPVPQPFWTQMRTFRFAMESQRSLRHRTQHLGSKCRVQLVQFNVNVFLSFLQQLKFDCRGIHLFLSFEFRRRVRNTKVQRATLVYKISFLRKSQLTHNPSLHLKATKKLVSFFATFSFFYAVKSLQTSTGNSTTIHTTLWLLFTLVANILLQKLSFTISLGGMWLPFWVIRFQKPTKFFFLTHFKFHGSGPVVNIVSISKDIQHLSVPAQSHVMLLFGL